MKGRPIHKISYESLISWGCLCKESWYNEHLRGKSDEDLIIEREEAFARHLRATERKEA